jgi:hypothetical protein
VQKLFAGHHEKSAFMWLSKKLEEMWLLLSVRPCPVYLFSDFGKMVASGGSHFCRRTNNGWCQNLAV